MTRESAIKFCRNELDKFPELTNWKIHLTTDLKRQFLGLCSYKDKCIILNAHHIDIHPDQDIINTIRHEIAHALTPGAVHNEVWVSKAREIGCDNTLPCSNLSLTTEIIDAIRSGAQVEVSFEEEIIRKPKYQITRLQDKCEVCGKVAKSKNEMLVENQDDNQPNLKFITLECGHTLVKKIPKGTPFHLLISDEEISEPCAHDFDKNTCKLCGRHRPFQFQVDGMNFIEQALAI